MAQRNVEWSVEDAVRAGKATSPDGLVARSSVWWGEHPSSERPSKQSIYRLFGSWEAFAHACHLLTLQEARARETREAERGARELRDRARREARDRAVARAQAAARRPGREKPMARQKREKREAADAAMQQAIAEGRLVVRRLDAGDVARLEAARRRRLATPQPTAGELRRMAAREARAADEADSDRPVEDGVAVETAVR